MRPFVVTLALGALLLCAPAPALAQGETATALVSTVQRENEWFCSILAPRAALSGIVEQLARSMQFEVEGLELISPTALVTVDLRDRPVPQAVEWILGASGLRSRWRTGVLQIQRILPDSPTPDELRDSALATYTSALRSFPDAEAAAAAAFAKAAIFEQRGNIAQAIGAYDSLVRAFPQSVQAPEALIRAARQLFRQANWDAAAAHYADLLRLASTGPLALEARLGFASSLARKGEFRSALRLIAALDTASPALTRMEMHQRLLVRARCVLGEGNAATARTLLRKSENGGLETELELEFYELSARALPTDAPPEFAAVAWMEYARRATDDQRATAVSEATRLTRLAGDEIGALALDRWAELNGVGDATRAHALAAREALGLDLQSLSSDLAADRLARAERLARARLWPEAYSTFAQLREQTPALDESARTRLYTGLAKSLDGQDRVDEAITMLREGLELVTDAELRREFYLTAAAILESRSRIDDAIEAYRGRL